MIRFLPIVVIFIVLQSCNRQPNYFIDDKNEQKISLIDIDTVYKTITNDSIKIKIGFKNIPSDTIPFKYLRVEIVFDVNNDTSYKDDLSLGFLAFVPDNNKPFVKMRMEDILKTAAIKSLFKYSNLIDNGFYYVIKDMHYSGNYLIINISKSSFKMLHSINDSLNWNVISVYGDGETHFDGLKKYSDYYSPFYNEKERMK